MFTRDDGTFVGDEFFGMYPALQFVLDNYEDCRNQFVAVTLQASLGGGICSGLKCPECGACATHCEHAKPQTAAELNQLYSAFAAFVSVMMYVQEVGYERARALYPSNEAQPTPMPKQASDDLGALFKDLKDFLK